MRTRGVRCSIAFFAVIHILVIEGPRRRGVSCESCKVVSTRDSVRNLLWVGGVVFTHSLNRGTEGNATATRFWHPVFCEDFLVQVLVGLVCCAGKSPMKEERLQLMVR